MTGPQNEAFVARRIVMRRGLWEEIVRVSKETGLEIEEVVSRAIESSVEKVQESLERTHKKR